MNRAQKKIEMLVSLKPREFRLKVAEEMLSLWSEILKLREGKVCVWCDSTNIIHGHHIFARALCDRVGWFDYDNGMPLCYRCHFHRMKQEPDEYIEIRDEYLSKKGLTYADLRARHGRRHRIYEEELLLIWDHMLEDLSHLRPQQHKGGKARTRTKRPGRVAAKRATVKPGKSRGRKVHPRKPRAA